MKREDVYKKVAFAIVFINWLAVTFKFIPLKLMGIFGLTLKQFYFTLMSFGGYLLFITISVLIVKTFFEILWKNKKTAD